MLVEHRAYPRGTPPAVRHQNGASSCIDQNNATSLATVSIRIGSGSADDPIGKSGLAHLFEHLLFTGTHRIGRDRYAIAVQDLGAECNASTAASSIKFYETFSSEILPSVIGLETERFAGTMEYLTEEVLEREKTVVRRERLQRVEGAPYGDALEHLYRLLYGDTPLGRLPVGIVDEINSITLDDCVGYFDQCYRGDRVNVAVSGNVDTEEAAARLTSLVSVFANPLRARSRPSIVRPVGGVHEVARGLPPKIYFGYLLPPAESPAYDEVRLASYLLGKGQGSWLSKHVVDDGTVVSKVGIKTLTRIAAPSVGVIEAKPAPGVDVDRARNLLRSRLADLDHARIESSDVARASAYYESSWYADDDTTKGRADGLSLALLRSGDPNRYEQELEPATRFGIDDMAKVLRRWSTDRIAGEVIYR